MNTLRLPLKKKWYEMTKEGIKTEEYRNINEYWNKRLFNCNIGCTRKKYYGDCQEFINNKIINSFPCYKCEHSEIKHFDTTTLTLGYPSNSDKERIIEFENLGISIGYGKEEWGAEKDKLYFVIKHGKQLN